MQKKLITYRRLLKQRIKGIKNEYGNYAKTWDQAHLKGLALGFKAALEEFEKMFEDELKGK
jgi:hypothetical protein